MRVCVCVAIAFSQIWSVDYARRRITLNAQKTIVRSTLPRLTAYTVAQVGMETHGVIYAVRQDGCDVQFYSGVRAVASASDLRLVFVPTQLASSLSRSVQSRCSFL
jgi:hypothetical protein